MRRKTYDLDALRGFVTGLDLGSFSQAADRLGRSTSAVSAQLHKLELQVGHPLVRKQGRVLVPTDAGETLLGYARRLLALNDEAALALGSGDLEGRVRLGIQQDFSADLLPDVLGRFARTHPRVRLEVRVDRNAVLSRAMAENRLDLALVWGEEGKGQSDVWPWTETLDRIPLRWIGPLGGEDPRRDCLPLVLFDPPCAFRSLAEDSLDRAGIPWRVALVGSGLDSLWAGVRAGLGITLRTNRGLPTGVEVLEGERIPTPLDGTLSLRLLRGADQPDPAMGRLATLIRKGLLSF
ncbi:MAG: LysR family transcriptional regulator [Rhodospirillum sp.]|nr:LysR family transcriptional regulator [Rhodospirillum sp.]MCF8487873.1 LysR family transcriptional regulator [Rhodospirillum sp.]MCF8499195.1 LysR family transcriptional regulator [Rhodospirillum sp.]